MDDYSAALYRLAEDSSVYGRMNDATGSAYVKGQCGDELVFYLWISDGIIEEALYYTENGCTITKACGALVAREISGKRVEHAMSLSPRDIVDGVGGLGPYDRHCALLAAITLYKALGDYSLKP